MMDLQILWLSIVTSTGFVFSVASLMAIERLLKRILAALEKEPSHEPK